MVAPASASSCCSGSVTPQRLFLSFVAAWAFACGSQTNQASEKVAIWLHCEECTDGEIDSVMALGASAIAHLETALLAGPPDSLRAYLRTRSEAAFQMLRQYASSHGVQSMPVTEGAYTGHFVDNYVALYQIRAAYALGRLGGVDAQLALNMATDSAAAGVYRSDVASAIDEARQNLNR